MAQRKQLSLDVSIPNSLTKGRKRTIKPDVVWSPEKGQYAADNCLYYIVMTNGELKEQQKNHPQQKKTTTKETSNLKSLKAKSMKNIKLDDKSLVAKPRKLSALNKVWKENLPPEKGGKIFVPTYRLNDDDQDRPVYLVGSVQNVAQALEAGKVPRDVIEMLIINSISADNLGSPQSKHILDKIKETVAAVQLNKQIDTKEVRETYMNLKGTSKNSVTSKSLMNSKNIRIDDRKKKPRQKQN